MDDPYNLQRFVSAQNPFFDQVCSELRRGRKMGHWMWFIFPQLEGLGSSWMASKYGISSREDAEAYLKHPILGPRLRDCTSIVNRVEGRSVEKIFGSIDTLKFRSSVTLFANVTQDNAVFLEALEKYFSGQPDPRTLERL